MFQIKEKIVANRKLVKKIKTTLLNFGYNTEHLIRHVIRVECKNLIKNKLPKNMSILEISESEYWKSNLIRYYDLRSFIKSNMFLALVSHV